MQAHNTWGPYIFLPPPSHIQVGPPAEEETRRKRGRRKRQLVFFDPETQLSQAVLQAQIDNPHIVTRRPLLLTPPSHRLPSAAELLDNPCTCQ